MGVRVAVAMIAMGAVLTGCSGGGDAAVTLPTLTPSASPAAVTPSAVPSAATPATAQGAAAFARYFYMQIERAFAQRDPSLVAALSDASCQTCNNYIRSVTTLRDEHQRIEGKLVFTILLAEAPATDGKTARVDVIWSTPANKRYDSAGRLIHSQGPLSRVEETLELRRAGDSWMVQRVVA